VHLKYKCSWSDDVIRSRFVRNISSEARSPEGEVHQEMRDLKLQRLGNGFNLVQHCIRLKECYNGLCERIWKHWNACSIKSVDKGQLYELYNHFLPPLLCSCLCNKTRITTLPAEMFLQTRNAFELILHRTITISDKRSLVILIKASNDFFFVLAIFQRIFHTSI